MAAKAKTTATADEAEAPAAAPKKKFPLKMVIMAVAALVVMGGGAGAYMMLGHKHEEKAAHPEVKPVAFLDLPDIVVNLASSSDRAQYLKIKVVLEVANQQLVQQIQPVMPRVMDAFQTYLRELRPTDLEGSAGIYRLTEELTRRVNAAVEPAHVNAVLFKELVVQ
jgi:flagellar FliL protein